PSYNRTDRLVRSGVVSDARLEGGRRGGGRAERHGGGAPRHAILGAIEAAAGSRGPIPPPQKPRAGDALLERCGGARERRAYRARARCAALVRDGSRGGRSGAPAGASRGGRAFHDSGGPKSRSRVQGQTKEASSHRESLEASRHA